MAEIIQFAREPWQRQVCTVTGMACMASVECCCICKHQGQYRQAVATLYDAADHDWDQRHALIDFAKTGAPPEIA